MTVALNHFGDFVDPSCPINWQHPLNRGLVGEWSVAPGASTRGLTWRDFVRGGRKPNDLTPTGVATWCGPGGRRGGFGSMKLTGASSSYFTGTCPLGTGNIPHTVAAWVNVPSTTGGFGYDIATYGQNGQMILPTIQSNNLNFSHWADDLTTSFTFTNVWKFVAFTYVAGDKRIFIDGIQATSSSSLKSMPLVKAAA